MTLHDDKNPQSRFPPAALSGTIEIYDYRATDFLPLLAAPVMIALGITVDIYFVRHGSYVWCLPGFVLALIGLLLLIVRPIQFSRIIVAGDGVRASRFGHIWKFIEWSDIKKFAKVRQVDPVSNKPQISCYIFDSRSAEGPHRRKLSANMGFGPLFFDERIINYSKLLTSINRHIRHPGTRVVMIDHVADGNQAKTLWRRIEPKEIEVDICDI